MKKTIKSIITLIILVMVFFIPIKNFIKSIEYQNERIKYIKKQDNEYYCKKLYIRGDFEYTTTKIKVKNMEVNKNKILIDMIYYNYYKVSSEEEKLTVEDIDMLIEQYKKFLNNEPIDNDNFFGFVYRNLDNKRNASDISYDTYSPKVEVILSENYDKNSRTATLSEIEAAGNQALIELLK